VLDNIGIRSIKAEGRELLPAKNRGQKLARFSFRVQAPQSGKVELKVEAADMRGQTRTLRLPLVLDARPPVIEIERVDRAVKVLEAAKTEKNEDGTETEIPAKTETTLQISGKVVDDTNVDRITVQSETTFSPLSVPKGKEVNFFVEVPPGQATIIAVDAAGNRTTQVLRRR
jgi:hypothetical protein